MLINLKQLIRRIVFIQGVAGGETLVAPTRHEIAYLNIHRRLQIVSLHRAWHNKRKLDFRNIFEMFEPIAISPPAVEAHNYVNMLLAAAEA